MYVKNKQLSFDPGKYGDLYCCWLCLQSDSSSTSSRKSLTTQTRKSNTQGTVRQRPDTRRLTRTFLGKRHTLPSRLKRVITAAMVTTGEKHDGKQLPALIEASEEAGIEVEAVIGYGAYAEKDNLQYCKDNDIRNNSKLSSTVTHGNRKNSFEYNKDAGMYVCPQGHMAVRKCHSKPTKYRNNSECETYYFDVEHCKHCPMSSGCYKEGARSKTYTVTIKKDIHNEQMEFMKTKEFEENYSHRYKIEAKNAELKNRYGYGRANACGTSGMMIQGMSALFLANMKRIYCNASFYGSIFS